MKQRRTVARACRGGVALVLGFGGLAGPAAGQWSKVSEQSYLPAAHNESLRGTYPAADRLLNAFDYAHAMRYEALYAQRNVPRGKLESEQYDFVTRELLRQPPGHPVEVDAVAVAFTKLAPEIVMMFDWALLLQRQIYDVLADERLAAGDRDARIAELLAYYGTRPELALSSVPKRIAIMDGQYFSLAFRQTYPKYSGLIWTTHWLRTGLGEALLAGDDAADRNTLVDATIARFWQLLGGGAETTPRLLPLASAVSPTFAQRYPAAGIIFDNLYMMQEVVADILTSPEVPRGAKRDELLRQAELFRSDTAYAMPLDAWLALGSMIGANNMGGPAVGFAASLPEPTVARGLSLAGVDAGTSTTMTGMQHAPAATAPPAAMEAMEAMDHARMPGMQQQPAGMPAMRDTAMAAMQPAHTVDMQHADMNAGQGGAMRMGHDPRTGMPNMTMAQMMAMHERMMADPVIRERVATDPVLLRMMQGAPGEMPAPRAMPGMQHGEMNMSDPAQQRAAVDRAPAGVMPPGMQHDTTSMAGLPGAADWERAIDFMVRLLSDPQVQERLLADPELRRVWSDPELQRRLTELRSRLPEAPPAHRHQD